MWMWKKLITANNIIAIIMRIYAAIASRVYAMIYMLRFHTSESRSEIALLKTIWPFTWPCVSKWPVSMHAWLAGWKR